MSSSPNATSSSFWGALNVFGKGTSEAPPPASVKDSREIEGDKPEQGANSEQEELYLVERQRRFTPFNDFSSASLLPTDPKPLSWSNSRDEDAPKVDPNDWELRIDDGSAHSDGWQYAFNWNFSFQPKCGPSDLVRKRWWRRKRPVEGPRGILRVASATQGDAGFKEIGVDVQCSSENESAAGVLVWADALGPEEGSLHGAVAVVDEAASTPAHVRQLCERGASGVIVVTAAEALGHENTQEDQASDMEPPSIPIVRILSDDAEALKGMTHCEIEPRLKDPVEVQLEESDDDEAEAPKGASQAVQEASSASASPEAATSAAAAAATTALAAGLQAAPGSGSLLPEGDFGLGRAVVAAAIAENESKSIFDWDVLGDGAPKAAVGADLASQVNKMIGGLRNAVEDNLKYFSSLAIKWKDFSTLFVEILLTIEGLEKMTSTVAERGFENNAADEIGNGYWSLLRVMHCCLRKMRAKVVSITSERDSVFFSARASMLLKGAKDYFSILRVLKEAFTVTLSFTRDHEDLQDTAARAGTRDPSLERRISDWGTPVDGDGEGSDAQSTSAQSKICDDVALAGEGVARISLPKVKGLFCPHVHMSVVQHMVDGLDLTVLYGEKFGYQYPMRLRHFLRVIILATAAYSKGHSAHQRDGLLAQLAVTYFHGLNYFLQPEARASRVTEQYTSKDIAFIKSFWNLTEMPIATKFSVVVASHLEVIRVITIDASKPLRVKRRPEDGGGDVEVSIYGRAGEHDRYVYKTYKPPSTISARLLSSKAREGHGSEGPRMPWKGREPLSPSKHLIVHFHGGGFIAQSSASHEIYLRDWAKAVDCPIISIDYSLAPEHPFPVAVDQCFYAYCWAIQNCKMLGSTAESVMCVGDSAGGNLAAVTAMRAIEEGVTRASGVVMLYPALMVGLIPTPSRVLSLMDPLLPLGNLQLCVHAYAHQFLREHDKHQEVLLVSPNDPIDGLDPTTRQRIHHMSPLLAPDAILREMPPMAIMASELDPLLDDSVMFVRRLAALGRTKDLKFRVVPRLPHGWLNMYFIGDSTSLAASSEVVGWIQDMMKHTPTVPHEGVVPIDPEALWDPEYLTEAGSRRTVL